jgi:ribosomal protein L37AE/L43A
MSELLPCPFCGSHEVTRQSAMGEYWVLCETCRAGSAMSHYEQGADILWNTRPASATAVEVTEGMVQQSIMAYYAAIADAYDSQEDNAPPMSSDLRQAIGMRAALAAGLGKGGGGE